MSMHSLKNRKKVFNDNGNSSRKKQTDIMYFFETPSIKPTIDLSADSDDNNDDASSLFPSTSTGES